MWWGGFLLGGLLLILVSIPFFSFPKVLTHEKEKIRLMEKAAATAAATSSNTGGTGQPHTTTSATLTKDDTGYGKDIKGLDRFFSMISFLMLIKIWLKIVYNYVYRAQQLKKKPRFVVNKINNTNLTFYITYFNLIEKFASFFVNFLL